jgi:predicted GNAT family acetyltransferase
MNTATVVFEPDAATDLRNIVQTIVVYHNVLAASVRGHGFGRESMKRAEPYAVELGWTHAFLDTSVFRRVLLPATWFSSLSLTVGAD